MTSTDLPAYRVRFVAAGYDALNTLLWLPSGSDRLRRDLVDGLRITPGMSVLELGCGTGLVTRHLTATGATVTAVDSTVSMLAAARRRAPSARFVEGDVVDTTARRDLDDGSPFDRVVLGFVLHELAPDQRVAALRGAVERLAPGGRIGVLEWATPSNRLAARVWRSTVRTIEPAVAHDILDDGLDHALRGAGTIVVGERSLAGGRARVVIIRPDDADE